MTVELNYHRNTKGLLFIAITSLILAILIGSLIPSAQLVMYNTHKEINPEILPGLEDDSISGRSTASTQSTTLQTSASASSEPRIIKSPVHHIATSDDGLWMVVGSRYTSNNEIREVIFYKWDQNQYLEVGRLGEEFHRANALDLQITDLNRDGTNELALASSDGYLYLFEFWMDSGMLMINSVWQSLFVVNAFDIEVADVDEDGVSELLLAAWTKYAIVFGIDPLDYNASDFWGSYHERWRSDMLKSQVLSIAGGDFDGNGLYDIMVGSRDGSLIMFEDTQNYDINDPNYQCDYKNSGTNTNGKPHGNDEDNIFDLCYAETWTDTENIWKEVLELESYDIDTDGIDEIVITALSQDVFVLNFDGTVYSLEKLTYEPQLWERSGAYPIDHWVDSMISAENVTFDGLIDEPMNWLDPNNVVSPYRSGMTNRSLDHFSYFSDLGSFALLDWGNYEEAVGGGNLLADILVHLEEPYTSSLEGLKFSIAQDSYENITHSSLTSSDVWLSDDNLTIFLDIDPYLTHRKFEYARYLAIQTLSGYNLSINYVETVRINYRFDSVRSVMFDSLNIDGQLTPILVVSTSQGNFLSFSSREKTNPWDPSLQLIANSYEEQDFLNSAGGAWDMMSVQNLVSLPNWVDPKPIGRVSGDPDLIVNQLLVGPATDEDLSDGINDYNGYMVLNHNQVVTFADPTSPIDPSLFVASDSAFSALSDFYATYTGGIRIAFSNIYQSVEAQNNHDYSELFVSTHSNVVDVWNFDGVEYVYNQSLEFNFSSSFFTNLGVEPLDIASGDVNGDGYVDLVVGNTTHFELFAKVGNQLNYTHIPGFFDDVELELNKYGYHEFRRLATNMQLVDYDLDGDLDFLLSLRHRPGFTLFEQVAQGSGVNWVEKREFVHFRQPATTFTLYDYELGVLWTPSLFDGRWHFSAIDRSNQLTAWDGEFQQPNTWLLVSDETLSMVMIDFSNIHNWGYQYIEIWNDKFYFEDRGNPNESCETRYLPILLEEIQVKGGDSDGDGIMDGLEAFSRRIGIKTDISDPDTDGDGLSDRIELQLGYDPRDYDSDNDLLPDGMEYYVNNGLTYCQLSIDENYVVQTIEKVLKLTRISEPSSVRSQSESAEISTSDLIIEGSNFQRSNQSKEELSTPISIQIEVEFSVLKIEYHNLQGTADYPLMMDFPMVISDILLPNSLVDLLLGYILQFHYISINFSGEYRQDYSSL